MTILFLSNWGVDDGITKGTIIPFLDLMIQKAWIEKVVLCTMEVDVGNRKVFQNNKVMHFPLPAGRTAFMKMLNTIRFPLMLMDLVKRHSIDLIWCKGAPAGGIGSLVNVFSGTSLVIDSFEPHRDYMVASGTWSKRDLKAIIQKYFERLAKIRATCLLPVSYQYEKRLLREGIREEKIHVLPCLVNIDRFRFRQAMRDEVRSRLLVDEKSIVGVYVGKYGGLYYDDEAFRLYKRLFDYFGFEFFLIVISEMDSDAIHQKLKEFHIPMARTFVSRVDHHHIPAYLCAADFAISTIKSAPAMGFSSPIKHGEYWASDLPILSTLLFGDDADVMRNEGGGVLIDILDPEPEDCFKKLRAFVCAGRNGKNLRLAIKYRNLSKGDEAIQIVRNKVVTQELSGE